MGHIIWNPWHGCHKFSEGCLNCYMYYLDALRGRYGGDISRAQESFYLPLKKRRDGTYKINPGTRVMVCLSSDFFLEEADEWREEVWEIIRKRPDLEFVITTKRIRRAAECLPGDWADGYKNVSVSVSVENQRRADERIPVLLGLPFHEKNIFCAPLIGSVNIEKYLSSGQIASVMADGENHVTAENARPCNFEWVEALHRQCVRYGVSFEFAGTGAYFVKDGKKYFIHADKRREQAIKSGLNFKKK